MSEAGPTPVRPLTPIERDLLIALIEEGADLSSGVEITAAERAAWLSQVAATFAGARCACGMCPSIELVDADGRSPECDQRRVVLEASTDDAVLLLFIDDDRLSYLELAPIDPDATIDAFPAASAIIR